VYGWEVPSYHAEKICVKAGKRLCSSHDVHNFALQDRFHCQPSWAQNTDSSLVEAHIASSKSHKCLSRKPGVFPNKVSQSEDIPYFWCLANKADIGT
jgi:hypothetical protein